MAERLPSVNALAKSIGKSTFTRGEAERGAIREMVRRQFPELSPPIFALRFDILQQDAPPPPT